QSAGTTSNFAALSFPEKLRALVGSGWFESTWWGHGGNCTVIDEEQFQVEALRRKGPFRVCGTESRKGFILQFHVWRFTPLQCDCHFCSTTLQCSALHGTRFYTWSSIAGASPAPIGTRTARSLVHPALPQSMLCHGHTAPPDRWPWAAPHCPTCSCSPFRADAVEGPAPYSRTHCRELGQQHPITDL
ncbi:hypothetical protein CIB84_009976, partial [Bambusicola thoracicus]